MGKVILVRYGEISLKGMNRSYFMNKLYRNMKVALKIYSGTLSNRYKEGIYCVQKKTVIMLLTL